MKKFNAIAPVLVIMAVLIFGTTANAGILVPDATGSETPSPTCTSNEKPDWGILINSIVGILINAFGETSAPDVKTSETTNCGILINA